jgi:glycosyltransferase involved in cell wall biosynthesis
MKILVAHSFYRLPGGEDRYVAQQMQLLERRHTVALFSRRNDELEGGLSTAAVMTVSSSRDRRDLRQVIASFRPDVIHLHNAYPALGPAVHLEAQRAGIPLVMTVHNCRLRCPNGYMFTEGKLCNRCQGGNYSNAVLHHCFSDGRQAASYASSLWIQRFLLHTDEKVAIYVTPSQFMHDRMIGWGFPGSRVNVVRNFTDHRLGSADPGTYGIYLGRLSSEKGVDVLLQALSLADDPPFHICGEGPAMPALRELAAEKGLRNVHFLGQLPGHQVAAELHGSRFFVLPSLWDENAPIAALEAMAAGRPLVVTESGGLPELVSSGEGLICRRGNAEDLAAKIKLLAEDDRLCFETGSAALQRAAAEFTPEAHLQRLEGLYARVLGGAAPGGPDRALTTDNDG